METRLVEDPGDDAVNAIRSRLQAYNREFLEVQERRRFCLEISDQGRLVAGCVFSTFGQWLEVDFLWVDEARRGTGLGSALMGRVEQLAAGAGCTRVSLNTFSFQARPFYEKLGFRVVYTQENYPQSSLRFFMEKEVSGT